MSTETVEISLAQVVFDYNVYPRHKVSMYHVNSLIESLKGGAEFPPIILDKKSKRIIDGFHRATAYKQINGPDFLVKAQLLPCKDEADVIVKSIEYNNHHGLRLAAWDQSRCLWLMEKYNIDKLIIQKAIGVTQERLDELRKRNVEVRNETGDVVRETQLKRGQNTLANKPDGRYVTISEAEIIESGRTTGLSSDLRLTTLIKDFSMEMFVVTKKNIARVKELYELIGTAIEAFEQGE